MNKRDRKTVSALSRILYPSTTFQRLTPDADGKLQIGFYTLVFGDDRVEAIHMQGENDPIHIGFFDDVVKAAVGMIRHQAEENVETLLLFLSDGGAV